MLSAHPCLLEKRFYPKRTQQTLTHTRVGSEKISQNTEVGLFKLN